jgi:hypothetical protein
MQMVTASAQCKAPNAQEPNAQQPNAQQPNAQQPNAQQPNAQLLNAQQPAQLPFSFKKIGRYGTRTCDPHYVKVVRYQLRQPPIQIQFYPEH